MAEALHRVAGPVATAAVAALVVAAVAGGAPAQRKAVTATVIVTDRSLTVSRSSVLEGVLTFVAVNRGRTPHALAIRGPSLALRTPSIAHGRSARLKVVVRPGRYALWDPVGLGRAKQRFLEVSAPPKTEDPSLVRPGSTAGSNEATWDCAEDLNDERC